MMRFCRAFASLVIPRAAISRWSTAGPAGASGCRRFAADLVAQKVDLIVTQGAAATLAAKNATATIPIVMASSQNAVGDGLVASLARPAGNVTGRSLYAPEITPKRLELLKETVPGLSHVALLWNVQNPGGAAQYREAELAARALGLRISSLDIRIPEDLDRALAGAVRAGAGALRTAAPSATARRLPPPRSSIASRRCTPTRITSRAAA
jgi:putative ABC transport system substrate-binding protein